MNGVLNELARAPRVVDYGPISLLTSLLAAFFIGQLIAWVYTSTHTGLSYSRGFAQSLVLLTMVSALVMYVIGDSVVTAFGLIGALAIIRFRNVLKDTRDTVFVFFCLLLGMATGSQRYGNALVGAAVLLTTVGYLYWTRFGSRGIFDGHLTARLGRDDLALLQADVLHVIGAFCGRVRETTMHDVGQSVEFVWEVRLRDPRRGSEMVTVLRTFEGMGDVSLVLRDELTEM